MILEILLITDPKQNTKRWDHQALQADISCDLPFNLNLHRSTEVWMEIELILEVLLYQGGVKFSWQNYLGTYLQNPDSCPNNPYHLGIYIIHSSF